MEHLQRTTTFNPTDWPFVLWWVNDQNGRVSLLFSFHLHYV
jgi:hypothetical protein